MNQQKPFALRIELGSSVIIGHRLTLDGILASLIFERYQCIEKAHSTIPLKKVSGVWAGSAALMEGPAPTRPIAIIQALRARLDLTPDKIVSGKRGYPRIEDARGPYRNKMTSYTAHDASALWFSGFGDTDRVMELMEHIPGVGAKRNIGYGRVVGIQIVDSSIDNAGIAFGDGSPARPIPSEAWNELGGQSADMAMEAWCPPYWSGERIVCALPRHSIVGRKEAKILVGV